MAIDRISVVIPCLNERETISRAVAEAQEGIRRSGLSGEVIVADNGSDDGSQDLARSAGARVVDVKSRGYGSALHYGVLSAGPDSIVVFADADLSYPFAEIPSLVGPLVAREAEFVLGSRLGGTIERGAMPFLNRYLGTPVLSLLIRMLHRVPASDCNSGMRAFRRADYDRLRMKCPGMEYASEMLIRVAQSELGYLEVPISFRKDQRSRAPHLRRWRDGWRHLRFILGHASSVPLILVPALIGGLLLALALLISWQPALGVVEKIHFHTAFVAIAAALPLVLFALSNLMIKAVLHMSGSVESELVRAALGWVDRNRPIQGTLIFLALAGVETCLLFADWAKAGYGALFEMAPLIRIVVFSVAAASLFCLDMGFGVLQLVSYERRGSSG